VSAVLAHRAQQLTRPLRPGSAESPSRSAPSSINGVRNDEDEREFAYHGSRAGARPGRQGGWTVITVKNDWAAVL
jgi:hypothetical protein